MDNLSLYVAYHECITDKCINVYRGIYQPNTPLNTRNYAIIKNLGKVNLTQRTFRKYAKHLLKLVTIIPVLTENGFTPEFINEVINTILTKSEDKSMKVNTDAAF
jgi:hypothetical protein